MSPNVKFATLDYSDEAPALYLGESVDFDFFKAQEFAKLRRVVMSASGLVNVDGLAALFQFPPDMAPLPMPPNRLNDQVLVRAYDQDWKHIIIEDFTPRIPAIGKRGPGWSVDQRRPAHRWFVRERFIPDGSSTPRSGPLSSTYARCETRRRDCRWWNGGPECRMATSQKRFHRLCSS